MDYSILPSISISWPAPAAPICWYVGAHAGVIVGSSNWSATQPGAGGPGLYGLFDLTFNFDFMAGTGSSDLLVRRRPCRGDRWLIELVGNPAGSRRPRLEWIIRSSLQFRFHGRHRQLRSAGTSAPMPG